MLSKIKGKSARDIATALNPLERIRRYRVVQARKQLFYEIQEQLKLWVEGKLDGELERRTRLVRILRYARAHCPYYQRIFDESGFDCATLDNFTSIPLLDKASVRTYQSEITSDEAEKLGYYHMNTGGSTGEPLGYIVSMNACMVDNAHRFMSYNEHGFVAGDKVASFDGSSVTDELQANNIFWTYKGDPKYDFERLHYSSLYLKPSNIHYYIEHMQSYKPALLCGYPSFLNSIAEYILENNIQLGFKVKGVSLTSETIYEWQIANIRKAFDTDLALQYGHSEISVLGFTRDDSYEYHCSPLYGYVEVLDSNGIQVKPGEVGEVVATSFNNFAMPFIRYRTGDIARYNGEHAGTVLLGEICGRTQDFVVSGDGHPVSLTALVFGQHYKAFGHISKWQIEQHKPGYVVISVVPGAAFSKDNEDEITTKFAEIAKVKVDIKIVSDIPLTMRGKHRFMVQHLM